MIIRDTINLHFIAGETLFPKNLERADLSQTINVRWFIRIRKGEVRFRDY